MEQLQLKILSKYTKEEFQKKLEEQMNKTIQLIQIIESIIYK